MFHMWRFSYAVPLGFAMSAASSLPPVSVLVRSMGRPVLANALASIAAQTYAALEVVVVAACGDSHPLGPKHVFAQRCKFIPGIRKH